jgi:Barrel-sandwich domain of CusB or HlyD membrane-fusion
LSNNRPSETSALAAHAQTQQAQANLEQARVNLERIEIRSPVNGYVINLLTQLGDYANVGQNEISLIDADSFWVDGYFEETSLDRVQVGDPAEVKLMGYSQIIRGHVGSIARRITSQMRSKTGKGSRRSIRSSLRCGSRSASQCAYTWIRCRRPGSCGRNDRHRADQPSIKAAGRAVKSRDSTTRAHAADGSLILIVLSVHPVDGHPYIDG